jgi:uncharacterized membrane protein
MSDVGTAVLILGLVLTALMSGTYFAFSTAVVPGLARTDDRTYVTAMQRINESILNPRFLTTFMGALIVPIVAVFLHLGDGTRDRLPWIIAGAALYAATVAITGGVNIPLNNRLMAAGDVDVQAAAAARAGFHDRWLRFNLARTVLCLAAVVTLAIALSRPVA